MNDYPNDGEVVNNADEFESFPEAPEEQQTQDEVEQSRLASSISVIDDVLKWFDDQAAGYNSVDALAINEATDPMSALVSISVVKRVKAELETKATEFRADFAKYLDKPEQ